MALNSFGVTGVRRVALEAPSVHVAHIAFDSVLYISVWGVRDRPQAESRGVGRGMDKNIIFAIIWGLVTRTKMIACVGKTHQMRGTRLPSEKMSELKGGVSTPFVASNN